MEKMTIPANALRSLALAEAEKAHAEMAALKRQQYEEEIKRRAATFTRIVSKWLGVEGVHPDNLPVAADSLLDADGNPALTRATIDGIRFTASESRNCTDQLYALDFCNRCGGDIYSREIRSLTDLGYWLKDSAGSSQYHECRVSESLNVEEAAPKAHEPADFTVATVFYPTGVALPGKQRMTYLEASRWAAGIMAKNPEHHAFVIPFPEEESQE